MSLDTLLERLEMEATGNDKVLLDQSIQCKTVSPVTPRNPMGLPEKTMPEQCSIFGILSNPGKRA